MFEAGAIIWRIQTVGANVLKQDLNQSEQAAKAAGTALSGTAKSTDELGSKSQSASPAIRSVGTELTSMSDRGKQAARDVGGTLTAIGASVTALTVLTVNAAKDWETAWAGVTKTIDAPPEQLAEIEDGLRDLSKVLPASHDEIAAVAEAAGQLGVKAKDIVSFTKVMIDLGETTNLTADEAATSLAQFMNIMRTAPEDVGRLGAAVVDLGNNGASTERDIVQMSQRIAGAAQIIGLSEGETLGLANALASVGIEAEAGGSSISNVMIDIATAVSEKGDKLLKWADLAGLSADEFAEKYRTKPAEALALVIEGMGRLNETGGDVFATLSDLGQTDIRVTRSLLSLAGSGDLLRESLERGNQAWEDNTALQNEAEKRYETTAAQLDMARNAVVDMAIELGEHLLPIVAAGAEAVAGFSDIVGALPDEVQGGVAVLGALAGGVTLFGGVALFAIPQIVEFRQAVRVLSEEFPTATGRMRGMAAFMTGPWGIAIAAVIATLAVWQEHLQRIRQLSTEYVSTLDEETGAVTRNTRAKLAQDLANDGVYEAAAKAGISAEELTDAILGEGDALESVRQKMVDYSLSHGTGDAILTAFGQGTLPKVGQALDAHIKGLEGSKASWEAQSDAMGEGAAATDEATEAYAEQNEAAAELEQQLDSLLELLDESNQTNRDAITANLDYRDALAEVDAAIQNARDGVEGYTNTLDPNTQAGRENMGMLVDLASSAWDAAEAQLAVDGNTQAFQASLQASRDALVQRAMDLGYNSDQANALADSILRIPSEKESQIIADTAQAQRAIDAFMAKNARLNLTVYGTFNGVSGVPRGLTTLADRAMGGIDFVQHMAMGGIPSNAGAPAQVRRAGAVTVWAEHETGGESYIPWANDHRRPRAVAILDRTADEFGYELVQRGTQRAAEGGISVGPASLVRPAAAAPTAEPVHLSDASIDRLARALATLMRTQSRDGGPTSG